MLCILNTILERSSGRSKISLSIYLYKSRSFKNQAQTIFIYICILHRITVVLTTLKILCINMILQNIKYILKFCYFSNFFLKKLLLYVTRFNGFKVFNSSHHHHHKRMI